jgi:signal transduction histidine kinase
MRMPRATKPRLIVAGVVLAAIAAGAWFGVHERQVASVVPLTTYQLRPGNMNQWEAFGGSWEIVDGAVKSNSYERGAKLLTGSSSGANYTMNSDMWFDGPAADMGVVIRTNEEAEGVDAYSGYFVGFRSLDGTLVLGRADYSWIEVLPVIVPGGIHPYNWYRLRVTAFGCNIAASVTNLATSQTAWIAFEERRCVKSGRFGLRTLNANAMWRNISVEPATWNDYYEMEKHAGFVQHPLSVNGPPWWTPWHVSMLFAGALALALTIQLSYFRVRNWKAETITRERERLAHEIHDTMAQGFAGVGYQIQGIRSSIVRGERVDSRHIADQLSVAYQLVRSCHEEASRTIAMLGSTSPTIQHNVLGALAETARKAAGDKIKIISEIKGNPIPLNLRLADAILHIGQEAIANALVHGTPTVLRIALTYEVGSVQLGIEDNGSGFEYSPQTAGFGILGMQKRARNVSAALNISSTPGQGTQVSVRASLQKVTFQNRLLKIFKERSKASEIA